MIPKIQLSSAWVEKERRDNEKNKLITETKIIHITDFNIVGNNIIAGNQKNRE